MRYLSVCSGIEAATVAWHPLGWQAAAYSEIEAFPRAVLTHHYPDTPLHGDFTTIRGDEYGPIDLLVGGTPCQSFSIAGLRGGMADDRGNLALEYLRLADRKRPRWLVWENVPGVLSSNDGRDFGSFLGALVELGYGFTYRILDAQYFGVAQRRRRVFVVGYLGDWRRAGAVLVERHSLSGDFAPCRQSGQVAPTIPSRGSGGGGLGTDFDCDWGLIAFGAQMSGTQASRGKSDLVPSLQAKNPQAVAMWPAEVCPTLDTYYGDKMGLEDQHVFNQRGGKFVPISVNENQQGAVWASDTFQALNKGGGKPGQGYPAVAFAIQEGAERQNVDTGPQGKGWQEGAAFTLEARHRPQSVATSAVRRLTPRECERLQGFPDDYTLVPYRGKPAADGPRYKALGNSMAVPVMRWIGERIARVEALSIELEKAA